MGQLFLGVDGGGTKCRMRLTDHNLDILGEAIVTTPANLQIRRGDAAFTAIKELCDIVFPKAGIDKSDFGKIHACFGMAGARMQSARDSFAAREFPFAAVSVVDDIDIARAGAHEGEDGAVLIIGTGSAGLGQVKGKRLQIGGWGFLLGDGMAGATLGRELLRKSLLAHEEIEAATPLTKAVMAQFDNDPQKIMTWSFENPDAYTEALEIYHELHADQGHADQGHVAPVGPVHARPGDYGKFVPIVFEYLKQDDPLAKELLDFELAAIDQYMQWFLNRGTKSIALVGGLGEHLYPMLKQKYPQVLVPPKSSPLQGAIILAAQSAVGAN